MLTHGWYAVESSGGLLCPEGYMQEWFVLPCFVIVPSETETFHPAWKLLKQKVNNSKWLQEVPETDQIHRFHSSQSKQGKMLRFTL